MWESFTEGAYPVMVATHPYQYSRRDSNPHRTGSKPVASTIGLREQVLQAHMKGIEPSSFRLTTGCSTIELHMQVLGHAIGVAL
jgi:hypothetical protein